MKILKPILYCLLGFVLAFACMYFISNSNTNNKTNNKEVIDKDIPIVELQVSSRDISVGETVTYSIISKVESDSEAFENNRTFYYDFTGDGVWDLVIKKDTVDYTFTESYEDGVSPKVAVEFRGKLGQTYGDTVFVKEKLRPILLYNSIGNTVIFRDISKGKLLKREICFEESECKVGNPNFRITHIDSIDPENKEIMENIFSENDSFLGKYDNYGEHNVSIYLEDKYGIEIKTGFVIKTSSDTSNGRIVTGINMITIPETTFTNGNPEIFLSNMLNNTFVIYINNENNGICYVDTDISSDSNGDGETDNDEDIMCNEMAKINYEPNYESVIGRIYFTTENNNTESKDFTVYIEQ